MTSGSRGLNSKGLVEAISRRVHRLARLRAAPLPRFWTTDLDDRILVCQGGEGGDRESRSLDCADRSNGERQAHLLQELDGPQRRENTMSRLSRRQFLWTSGTALGAAMAVSRRAGAAGPELIPKKLPFPPNDEFGSYEPTITPDGNTIYFARFAGSGDKRVLSTTTDIFVTHRSEEHTSELQSLR